jgi:hypothetical protein
MIPELEAQKITRRVARLIGLKGVPQIRIFNTKNGRAHPKHGWFSVPAWAMKAHRSFAIAFIIHELAHFGKPISYYCPTSKTRYGQDWIAHSWALRPHCRESRQIEAKIAEKFGFRPVFRRGVYADSIRDMTGKPVCDKQGNPIAEQAAEI